MKTPSATYIHHLLGAFPLIVEALQKRHDQAHHVDQLGFILNNRHESLTHESERSRSHSCRRDRYFQRQRNQTAGVLLQHYKILINRYKSMFCVGIAPAKRLKSILCVRYCILLVGQVHRCKWGRRTAISLNLGLRARRKVL